VENVKIEYPSRPHFQSAVSTLQLLRAIGRPTARKASVLMRDSSRFIIFTFGCEIPTQSFICDAEQTAPFRADNNMRTGKRRKAS
jgi:hypothetical protein